MSAAARGETGAEDAGSCLPCVVFFALLGAPALSSRPASTTRSEKRTGSRSFAGRYRRARYFNCVFPVSRGPSQGHPKVAKPFLSGVQIGLTGHGNYVLMRKNRR